MGHVLRLAPVTQTKHYYCQTPIDGDTVCGFLLDARRTVRGEGQLPSRLYALWSRLPPHGQGDETSAAAETTETQGRSRFAITTAAGATSTKSDGNGAQRAGRSSITGRPMARPDLMMVCFGRCPSCGVSAFLWATWPRAKIKRCLRCANVSEATVGHRSRAKGQHHDRHVETT